MASMIVISKQWVCIKCNGQGKQVTSVLEVVVEEEEEETTK